MVDILLNRCFGAFQLSKEAEEKVNYINKPEYSQCKEIWRTDPDIIAIFDSMGSDKFSGSCSKIEKITLPDGITDLMINEYDGVETVIYVLEGKIHGA